MEGRVQKRCMQTAGLRAGEEGDGAYWRARIYNYHTGDPGWRETPEMKEKMIGHNSNVLIKRSVNQLAIILF